MEVERSLLTDEKLVLEEIQAIQAKDDIDFSGLLTYTDELVCPSENSASFLT